MHFPIIAIESLETERADFMKDLPYDDPTFNRWCDYYGELYDEERRKDVIKSDWLKSMFDGIATIDVEKETITFLDKETIDKTIREYLINLTGELHGKAHEGKLCVFDLRFAAKEYKGHCTLFCKDNYGQTSLEFMEDASWSAGETVKIGNVFDAHF